MRLRLWDKVTRYTRRALTGTPAAPTHEAYVSWMEEQIREYAQVRQYAGPGHAGTNFTGETVEMRLAYRTMLKEPAVYAPLLAKTFAVASLDPQITPEDEDDPKHREAAGFVGYAVGNSVGGWPRLLMNVMLPAEMDGFSVTEKVFGTVPAGHPKYGGFFTLKAAKDKDSTYLRLKLDEYRGVMGIQALQAGQGAVPLDPRDFIFFTHLSIFQSPFGISALRPVYRAFNLIGAAIKLRSILLENFSGPFLQLKLADKQLLSQAKANLADARARGFIVIGKDDDMSVINLATSAPDQFQQSIEDLRKEASLGLRGAYLQSLESSSPQGDSKTHKTQTELFDWYLATSVCATLREQLLPDLVEPNYGAKGGQPGLSLGGIDPAAVSAELDKLMKVKQLGVDLSVAQIRRLGGAEAPRDDSDKIAANPAPPGGPPPGPGGDPSAGGGDAQFSARLPARRPARLVKAYADPASPVSSASALGRVAGLVAAGRPVSDAEVAALPAALAALPAAGGMMAALAPRLPDAVAAAVLASCRASASHDPAGAASP